MRRSSLKLFETEIGGSGSRILKEPQAFLEEVVGKLSPEQKGSLRKMYEIRGDLLSGLGASKRAAVQYTCAESLAPDDEGVKAKDGAGSATLSMAFAGAEFADYVMAGLSGEKVTQCTFVDQTVVPEAKFFSLPCSLGKEGVETIHSYGSVNAYEEKLIADMIPDLVAQADKGFKWAESKK